MARIQPETLSNMGDQLDGAYLKLARADGHLESIKSAIESDFRRDPEDLTGEPDTNARRYVFRATHDSPDPTQLSPLIGDFVQNVRASLDYLVWELVSVAGNAGTTSNEFPIFTDPKRYVKDSPKKIHGVPPEAVMVFERLQPFAGANSQAWNPNWRDPDREPLTLLRDLSIRDKHRSINLTTHVMSAQLLGLEELGIYAAPVPSILTGYFERGAVIARLQLTGERPVDAYAAVRLRTAFDIGFEDSGPAGRENVVSTLDRIRQEVRERVFPAFAQFFPPR
jgi:hypothetical protein